MPNNPLKHHYFWPTLASVVSTFWAAKVEGQGSTILDRKVEEFDVAFMKDLKLKEMEFVLPAEDEENYQVREKFLIKRKGAEDSLAFSNRQPGRGEMRGALLRQRLGSLKAENENLTLYEALTNLFHENIKDSDLITYFTKGKAFYDDDAEAWPDPVYVNVTKELAHLLLQYKKAHPETTEEELIAYGKSKEVMEAAVRAAGQPQRDGLTLLEDTLSGLLGAISDAFRALVGASKHSGINLAIGGKVPNWEGATDSFGNTPNESGEWGHMYLHQDTNIVMVGVEASAPGKHNVRTGESHSKTGAAGELSPSLQKKIDSKALREEQIEAGKTPLSTKEKYNWATVKISPLQLQQMIAAEQGTDYVALVRAKPSNAKPFMGEAAQEAGMAGMETWAKATKEGNKTSMAAKIFGFLLFAAVIVLAFTPIPGVSQAVGTWLAAMGVGVATGTATLGAGLAAAAVGLGIFALGTRQDPEKPHTLYEKNLSKRRAVEVVQEHDVVQELVVVDERRLSDSGSDHDLRGFEELDAELRQVVKHGDEVVNAEKIVDGINEPKPVHSPVVVVNPSTKKEVVHPTNTDQTTFTV